MAALPEAAQKRDPGSVRDRELACRALKSEGRPKGALQKVKNWSERRSAPLALEVLVMEAHVPFPFSGVETLRLRSRDLKLVNCLSAL
jgi:hypothetical protein